LITSKHDSNRSTTKTISQLPNKLFFRF